MQINKNDPILVITGEPLSLYGLEATFVKFVSITGLNDKPERAAMVKIMVIAQKQDWWFLRIVPAGNLMTHQDWDGPVMESVPHASLLPGYKRSEIVYTPWVEAQPDPEPVVEINPLDNGTMHRFIMGHARATGAIELDDFKTCTLRPVPEDMCWVFALNWYDSTVQRIGHADWFDSGYGNQRTVRLLIRAIELIDDLDDHKSTEELSLLSEWCDHLAEVDIYHEQRKEMDKVCQCCGQTIGPKEHRIYEEADVFWRKNHVAILEAMERCCQGQIQAKIDHFREMLA